MGKNKMKKTIKIVGIGAAALFVLMALVPAVSAVPVQGSYILIGPYETYEAAEKAALKMAFLDWVDHITIFQPWEDPWYPPDPNRPWYIIVYLNDRASPGMC
jgi:hypothetical protein